MLTWAEKAEQQTPPGKKLSLCSFLKAALDILLLRRLLKVNDVLWVGEWIFHMSLLILMLRHLRYFLEPVPGLVAALEIPGIIAAWLLPASLLYICIMKLLIEKKPYLSSYNFILLGIVMALCISGLLMKYVFPSDLVDIKYFTLSLVTFRSADPPADITFLSHFLFFLVLLLSLPAHIVAAPLTLLDARLRDEELPYLLHEKE